jgi:hypothetical protein
MRASAESPWIVISDEVEGDPPKFIDCHIDYGKQRAAFRISLGEGPGRAADAFHKDDLRRLVSVLADAVRENRIKVGGR